MKTYHSSSKDKTTKKSFMAKHIYTILLGFTVIAIATIITLSLVFGAKPNTNDKVDPPVVGPPAKVEFVLPIEKFNLGQEAYFNELVYSSTLNQWRTHNGVDFLAEAGSNVRAILDGTVTKIQNTMLDGMVVTITHADGYVSVYKGLDTTLAVAEGAVLKSGEKIGTVAKSMMIEQNEGPHLHLEMQLKGAYVNPLSKLPAISEK